MHPCIILYLIKLYIIIIPVNINFDRKRFSVFGLTQRVSTLSPWQVKLSGVRQGNRTKWGALEHNASKMARIAL
jgi:hypothetical protein